MLLVEILVPHLRGVRDFAPGFVLPAMGPPGPAKPWVKMVAVVSMVVENPWRVQVKAKLQEISCFDESCRGRDFGEEARMRLGRVVHELV